MAMRKVCLCMIVKNEALVIDRCLRSVAGFIDSYVIADTGSTDGTPDIIEKVMIELGKPGTILRDEWINYGENRSNVFSFAEKMVPEYVTEGDYMLVLDADDVAHIDADKSTLHEGVYLVKIITSDIEFLQRRLFKVGLGWRYVGALHEYPTSVKEASEGTLDHGAAIYSFYDGSSSHDPVKYLRHAILLKEDLLKNPEDPRNTFYLGQSFNAANMPEEAIKWYRKRSEMGSFPFEIFWSKYQTGKLLVRSGRINDAIIELLSAYETDPTRAEPLTELCSLNRVAGRFRTALIFGEMAKDLKIPDIGFCEKSSYGYRLWDELALCYYWTNDFKSAASTIRRNLGGGVPPKYSDNAVKTLNHAFHAYYNGNAGFPRFLQFETGTDCSSGCKMCPRGLGMVNKRHMSDEMLQFIIDQFIPHVNSVCPFLYQEPLQEPRLFDIVRKIKEVNPNVATTVYTTLNIDSDTIVYKLLDGNIDNVVISHYGSEWQPNVQGVDDFIMKLVDRRNLRRNDGHKVPFIGMHFVAFKDSMVELEKFNAMWRPMMDFISVVPYDDFCGVIPGDYSGNRQHFGEPLLERTPCRRLWDGMNILADGTIVPCCLDFNGSTPLGHLEEAMEMEDPKKVFKSEAFEELRMKHLRGEWDDIPLCKNCKVWQYTPSI